MSLVDRASAITLRPAQTWPVIAAEPGPPAAILAGYIAPLAAIGPIASAIGLSIIGIGMGVLGTYREPFISAIVRAVVTYVMILIGIGIITAIAAALAPNFGGRKDTLAALKLVGYAYTPAFLAGILSLVPQLAALELLAGLWTLYVFYLGAPVLILCAKEKALAFTATCVACAVVIGIVVGAIIGALGFAGMGLGVPRYGMNDAQNQAVATAAVTTAIADAAANAAQNVSATQSTSSATQPVADSSAPAAGVPVQAVKLISSDQLKALLPATAGGLSQVGDVTAATSSVPGLGGTSAQATYGPTSDAKITLAVADLGSSPGIAALANLGESMDAQSTSDGSYGKNVDVNGQKVHEKWDAPDKRSDLMEVVNSRYTVTVTGHGVDMATALSALQSIDMTKFEALGSAAN